MGCKVSKCGSCGQRIKVKINKNEKTKKHEYDDDIQNPVEVRAKKMSEASSRQVQSSFDFSMQMEKEFDVRMKSIVQGEIYRNSDNTDVVEDNSSYYTESEDGEEKEYVENDEHFVDDLQNWSIVSSDNKNQDEDNTYMSMIHSHSGFLTTKDNEDITRQNKEPENQLTNEPPSLENKKDAKNIKKSSNNHIKTRESPTQESDFDFIYYNKNLDQTNHQEQPVSTYSDADSITYENLANPTRERVTKLSNSSESTKNIETSEDVRTPSSCKNKHNIDFQESVNFDTSRLVLENPQKNRWSKVSIADDDSTENHLETISLTLKDYANPKHVFNEDDIDRKSSRYSNSIQSGTLDEINFGDENNTNQNAINDFKAIMAAINFLETQIANSDDESSRQNTYQALVKIMMDVNQVKNEEFDEEILDLQNRALNQINHCLKILKK